MPFVAPLLLFVGAQAPVEVPFRLGEQAIIVDATVNGRPVSLMFDTGFGGSVDLANTIDIGTPTGSQTLRDFVGEIQEPTVKLRNLSLGAEKIDVADLDDAVLSPPENYSFAYNTHCDGIMGFDVIKNNVTEINFQQHKFVFYPPSFDITKRTPDNKKTFLAKLLPIGGNSMEMAVETPSGKRMTMALDTGNAFYATTHKDVLERVGLWAADKKPQFMSSSGVASGAVDSWSFKMPPVTIFGVPVQQSVWDVIDLPSSSAEGDGTVGFGFLKNFNIIVDFNRRRVWLENFTGQTADAPEGDVGFTAAYDPKARRTVVVHVAPDGPADKAGVKEGDQLLSVDDTDLAQAGFRRVRSLLRGPIGSKVKVAISHNGDLKRVEMERKPLYNE